LPEFAGATRGLKINVITTPDLSNPKVRRMSGLEVEVGGLNLVIETSGVYIGGVKQTLPYQDNILYVKQATDRYIMLQFFGGVIVFNQKDDLQINIGSYYADMVGCVD